ncbi:Panacea domain-containing protein, partial [Faecalibacillus faecis]
FLKYINKELQNENSSIDKKLIIKSQREVNSLLTKMENENGKIYKVINWFLKESNEENPITHLSLQKSLYFVQSWSKIINNQWIFNDDCQAWIHGAVYPNIYEIFKNFKYDHLPQISKEIDLDEREIKLLKLVKKYYTDVYTPRTLENICHKEKPYKLARIGKNIDERSNEII